MVTLELRTHPVGEWQTNTYVLVCPETGESVLVDPGAEPDVLSGMLAGTRPVAILLTHTHPDHTGALDEMCARLNVPVMLHGGPHFQGKEFAADRVLQDGDLLRVGEHWLAILHTPGHTADAICLAPQDDSCVLVGDAIFEGGPGHTASAEDFHTTRRTLASVILRWPDDTVCYPGHGISFRLGAIRPAIESFLRNEYGEFSGDATWDMPGLLSP